MMKYIICVLVFGLRLIDCYGQAIEKKAISNTLSIQSQYNQRFIDGLAELFGKPYKLTDGYILVEHDTIYPPEHLPLNKEIILHGENKALLFKGVTDHHEEQFFLSIKRTSYTDLAYRLLQVMNDSVIVKSTESVAILDPGIVLEKNKDEGLGRLYFFPRFQDNSDTCSYEFMFDNSDEQERLSLDIHVICKGKGTEDSGTDYRIFLTEVEFAPEEK